MPDCSENSGGRRSFLGLALAGLCSASIAGGVRAGVVAGSEVAVDLYCSADF